MPRLDRPHAPLPKEGRSSMFAAGARKLPPQQRPREFLFEHFEHCSNTCPGSVSQPIRRATTQRACFDVIARDARPAPRPTLFQYLLCTFQRGKLGGSCWIAATEGMPRLSGGASGPVYDFRRASNGVPGPSKICSRAFRDLPKACQAFQGLFRASHGPQRLPNAFQDLPMAPQGPPEASRGHPTAHMRCIKAAARCGKSGHLDGQEGRLSANAFGVLP